MSRPGVWHEQPPEVMAERLRALLENRQMPDHAKVDVTLGELRRAFGDAAGVRREALREAGDEVREVLRILRVYERGEMVDATEAERSILTRLDALMGGSPK